MNKKLVQHFKEISNKRSCIDSISKKIKKNVIQTIPSERWSNILLYLKKNNKKHTNNILTKKEINNNEEVDPFVNNLSNISKLKNPGLVYEKNISNMYYQFNYFRPNLMSISFRSCNWIVDESLFCGLSLLKNLTKLDLCLSNNITDD